jgi:hypothetical protein
MSKLPRYALLTGLALVTVACGREESTEAENVSGRTLLEERTVSVPVDARWIATGLTLEPGRVLELVPSTQSGGFAGGSPLPDDRAPLPTYGSDGLIARVGDSGYPIAVAVERTLQGSSVVAGEELYLGRNAAPPQPVVGTTAPTDGTTPTGEQVVIPYDPEPYQVRIRVWSTDAPALLTPIDDFYDDNPNPVFDWDELDNASQYNLEISDFRDFRRILFSLNVNTTSVNTSAIGIDPTNPTQVGTGPNLQEGVYYWRVRAQVNRGRLLSPILEWTERSAVFRLGVETLQTAAAATLLTPTGPVQTSAGAILPFEILAPEDASGLLYRYQFWQVPCGEIPTADATVAPRLQSPWLVFQQTYQTNRIDQPRRLYGAFPSPQLEEGVWLLQVQTRDGSDPDEQRLGVLEYEFTAGCR